MRILYVNSPVYDFLTASVIEGLVALQSELELDLVFSERSNYAPRACVWSRARIEREASGFDWVILGTNLHVDRELFDRVARPENSICIDGADESDFIHPPERFRYYFKRELSTEKEVPEGVFPCPFAVERRWHSARERKRDVFFSAVFGPNRDGRGEILEFLSGMADGTFRLGPVAPSRFIGLDGVLRGQCSWRQMRANPFAVGHNRGYHSLLLRSQLSLSMPGEGWDTGRFWEILGSGAALVSPPPRIRMPHPFIEGEHFYAFHDLESLERILKNAREKPGEVESLRMRARDHVQAYHTSRERARFILDTLRGLETATS